MSETACKASILKSSKVPSFVLSNLVTKVSSAKSGFEGREEEKSREEESTRFSIVSVASFDSLSDCGKVEVFIDTRRPVGLEAKRKMIRPLKASTLGMDHQTLANCRWKSAWFHPQVPFP